MHKIVRPGLVNIDGYFYSLYIEIWFEDIGENKQRLSITGVEGPTYGGNAIGGCGQIIGPHMYDDDYIVEWAPGWSKWKFEELLDIWQTYHLNDMQAGCQHQWDSRPPVGAECPECGYRYGSKWNYRPIPRHAAEYLHDLPESDKEYPWAKEE